MSGRFHVRGLLHRSRRGLVLVVLAATAAVPGIVAVAPPAHAGMTITVTSAADPGYGGCTPAECTLREAIALSNSSHGTDTIKFAIGSGPVSISPTTNLPPISGTVVINGQTQPGFTSQPLVELNGVNVANGTGLYLKSNNSQVVGLVINRFASQEVLVEGSANVISGNYLGTSPSGTAATTGGNLATLRFRGYASNNSVTGNVIGGGSSGISVEENASANAILVNSIGVGADGVSSVGSGGSGVSITGAGVRGTYLHANSIAFNTGLGIDIGGNGPDVNDSNDTDTGPNNKQNYPVLTSVASGPGGVSVTGTLNSTSYATIDIDVYASQACDTSGYGEGQVYVGNFTVSTDAAGDASFDTAIPPSAISPPPFGYDSFTVTATQDIGGYTGKETSEFSACVLPYDPPGPPTGIAAGAGDGVAEVSWIAPDSDGGRPLDHYTVTSSPDTASTPFDVPAGTTTTTVPGLTNGTPYTFSVTATNDAALTSPASAPSESVTPLAGSAAPEAATADTSADGSLSTGGTASEIDPTNTSVDTPNAGIVSIGEGAMTGVPPAGVTYFGQQVDVTAPDAAAADPLRFAFVFDCSVLPADTSSCPYLAASTSTTPPSAATVDVKDGSYNPASTTVGQGDRVTWRFVGSKPHSVTDTSRLGAGGAPLFSSGNKPPGASYTYAFAAAGQYPYRSTTHGDPTTMNGTVDVPVTVSQASGAPDTAITVTWASSRAPGYRFDVQYRYKAPGGSSFGAWKSWRTNSLVTSGQFTGASLKGVGDYELRSHLENMATGKTSGWSQPTAVSVVQPGPSRIADIAVFHETEGGNVQVPDCTGPEGVVQPGPACTWSETINADGDLEVVVYTTENNRWRGGKVASP